MTADGDRWSVLVPVKRLNVAKSRLAVVEPDRVRLALAMACDTVRAAVGCDEVAEVVVISNDRDAAAALSALGARVVDDAPDAGLNPALRHGATAARCDLVAALSSDLPALRSVDLGDVLRRAAAHRRAVVGDLAGSGTTMLTARSRLDLAPQFGPGSRRAHVASGAVDLSADTAASLRHDVDTVSDLRAAMALGVGSDTARVMATVGTNPLGA
jgi:2-phospho-L-lactate/phosphoenolpyruvate guanylyltransferase